MTQRKRVPGRVLKAIAAAGVLLLGLPQLCPAFAAEKACPDELVSAARLYRRDLQEAEYEVRDSAAENPMRVEPTMIFDLSAHECHSMPGQTYKVFGPGECKAPRKGGVYKVIYPYNLYYRKAPRQEELFDLPWKEGSDGLWMVKFEYQVDRYVVVGQKEYLDLMDKRGRPTPPHGQGGIPMQDKEE